jgi:hypothetical protein
LCFSQSPGVISKREKPGEGFATASAWRSQKARQVGEI